MSEVYPTLQPADEAFLLRQDTGVERFPFKCDLHTNQRATFWEGRRQWFAQRGYTLYTFKDGVPPEDEPSDYSELLVPSLRSLPPHPDSDPLPFAYLGDSYGSNVFEVSTNCMVFFAQDAQNRHVAIKYVEAPSQQCNILKFLHEHHSSDPEACKHVLPILDLIPYDNSFFAIMPRWGEIEMNPDFATVEGVLSTAESLIESLVYLHDHRIIHRDIHSKNILTNHVYSSPTLGFQDLLRPELRASGRLLVTLFDFDMAIALPPGRRSLPWQFSSEGLAYPEPPDVLQGEYEYDPFAYDVACLANVLLRLLNPVMPSVPMLAPLLAGMSRTDPVLRFTAREALQFYSDRRKDLTPEQIQAPIPPDNQYKTDPYDPWEGLSCDFVTRWAHLRSPPPSLWTKFLRRICQKPWGRLTVVFIRQIISWTSLPRLRRSARAL